MSTLTASGSLAPSRRKRVFSVAAIVGVALALAWFVGVRLTQGAGVTAERTARVERGAQLIALLRRTAQDRVRTGAQVLAQDTRLQAAAGMAELDKATANDLLEDLQKLDSQELFALLSAEGRVIAARGAPQMEGLDLASSAVVKTALAQEGAATGVWMVDDRVVEIAVSVIRVGERRAGLLVVGVRVADAALATAAAAAGVHLALMLEGRPVWTSSPQPPTTWRLEPTATVEVSDAARYLVAAGPPPADSFELFAWAVPLAALLFAALGFWRGGGP
ncbi:MAG: hypothetical protein Q8L48_21715 [Archangium sp.]|nr:hypothetical protein [Archangium sp.]